MARKAKVTTPVETFTENCSNASCPGFQVPVGTWGAEALDKFLVTIYSEDGYNTPVCEVCKDTLLSSGSYFRTESEAEAYRHRYDEPVLIERDCENCGTVETDIVDGSWECPTCETVWNDVPDAPFDYTSMTFDESWRLIHDVGIGNSAIVETDGEWTLYEFEHAELTFRFEANSTFDIVEYKGIVAPGEVN